MIGVISKSIILKNFYDIKITHISGFITPDFWSNEPHSHDHCEIFIHLLGKVDIFVEQSLYCLHGHEIRLYRSNELHYGKTDFAQNMEWYQISIPHIFFKKPENSPLAAVLYNREAGKGNVFTTSKFDVLIDLLAEVFDSYEAKNILWPYYSQSAIMKILCILNEQKNNIDITAKKNKVLQNIIEIIYSDFQNISTVEDLSNITHYSTSYIYKIFKTNLNITPYRFIIDKKLAESKKALKKGYSISAACEFSGFTNYSNFITLFKRRYSITPKKYQSLLEI